MALLLYYRRGGGMQFCLLDCQEKPPAKALFGQCMSFILHYGAFTVEEQNIKGSREHRAFFCM